MPHPGRILAGVGSRRHGSHQMAPHGTEHLVALPAAKGCCINDTAGELLEDRKHMSQQMHKSNMKSVLSNAR